MWSGTVREAENNNIHAGIAAASSDVTPATGNHAAVAEDQEHPDQVRPHAFPGLSARCPSSCIRTPASPPFHSTFCPLENFFDHFILLFVHMAESPLFHEPGVASAHSLRSPSLLSVSFSRLSACKVKKGCAASFLISLTINPLRFPPAHR